MAALLPSLLYVDHWVDYLHQGHRDREELLADHLDASHHNHCHYGPGSCSEQPAPPIPRNLFALIELPEPELPTVALHESVSTPEEFVLAPPVEPPRL